MRYGPYHDTLRVYGWKKNNPRPEPRTLTFEPGCPIEMEWITTRIIKVKYGPHHEKQCILRFTDADKPWERLTRLTTNGLRSLPTELIECVVCEGT